MYLILLIQSNAAKSNSGQWQDKLCSRRIGKIGYAPILLLVITGFSILFIHSVITGKLFLLEMLNFKKNDS